MGKTNQTTIMISGENKSGLEPPVAIYARQSIDKKDSISIDTQIEDCINEYKRLGYAGPVFIFSDKGYSGKNTDRPAFREMMSLIENDKIHYVFAHKLDRISRSLFDFTQMQDIFERHGVDFNSKNDDFDTSTATGRTMLQIIIVFAELERKNTQQRVTDNYYHRIADSGCWGGGPAPYGFKNEKVNGVSSLVPFDEEMDVVKYIFNTFYSTPGISLGKLASDLTQKGYKARKSNFTNVSVGRILRNPIYVKADETLYLYFESVYFNNKDKQYVQKYNFSLTEKSQWDGVHAANIVKKRLADTRKRTQNNEHMIYMTNVAGIIDSKQFIEIQKKLENNKQLKKSNNLGKLQELTGLLKCAKCGRAIKMYNFPRLSCYGKVEIKDCDMKINPANGLTAAEALDDLRIKIGMCVTRYFVQLKKSCQNVEKANQKDRKEIDKLQTKIDNLVYSLQDIPHEALKKTAELMNKHSQRIAELTLDITMRSDDILLVEANRNLKYFQLTPPERQSILREVIDRIEINPDYTFRIIWKSKAMSDIEEYNTLEYTTNGRMRIKEEALEKLDDSQIDKLILETVELKVEATMYYCEMNGIEVPKSFFKRLSGQTLKNNYMLACEDALKYKQESACEPVAKSGIIISQNNDEKAGSKKYKRHASNRKTELLRQCIEDKDTSRLSSNEKMTVAFSLLLPEYKDGDQIEWLANTYNPKYAKIFSFLAI